jgi:hypothetical protein
MKRLDRACSTILRGIYHLRINVSARNDVARVAGVWHSHFQPSLVGVDVEDCQQD